MINLLTIIIERGSSDTNNNGLNRTGTFEECVRDNVHESPCIGYNIAYPRIFSVCRLTARLYCFGTSAIREFAKSYSSGSGEKRTGNFSDFAGGVGFPQRAIRAIRSPCIKLLYGPRCTCYYRTCTHFRISALDTARSSNAVLNRAWARYRFFTDTYPIYPELYRLLAVTCT